MLTSFFLEIVVCYLYTLSCTYKVSYLQWILVYLLNWTGRLEGETPLLVPPTGWRLKWLRAMRTPMLPTIIAPTSGPSVSLRLRWQRVNHLCVICILWELYFLFHGNNNNTITSITCLPHNWCMIITINEFLFQKSSSPLKVKEVGQKVSWLHWNCSC